MHTFVIRGEFNIPVSLGLLRNANIVVTDFGNHLIQIFKSIWYQVALFAQNLDKPQSQNGAVKITLTLVYRNKWMAGYSNFISLTWISEFDEISPYGLEKMSLAKNA